MKTTVLGTVDAGRSAAVLLDDEDLLLFEVVEQFHVVGGDEELCVAGIALPGPEPAEDLADDTHVQVTVDFVEYGRARHVECVAELRQQVEPAVSYRWIRRQGG